MYCVMDNCVGHPFRLTDVLSYRILKIKKDKRKRNSFRDLILRANNREVMLKFCLIDCKRRLRRCIDCGFYMHSIIKCDQLLCKCHLKDMDTFGTSENKNKSVNAQNKEIEEPASDDQQPNVNNQSTTNEERIQGSNSQQRHPVLVRYSPTSSSIENLRVKPVKECKTKHKFIPDAVHIRMFHDGILKQMHSGKSKEENKENVGEPSAKNDALEQIIDQQRVEDPARFEEPLKVPENPAPAQDSSDCNMAVEPVEEGVNVVSNPVPSNDGQPQPTLPLSETEHLPGSSFAPSPGLPAEESKHSEENQPGSQGLQESNPPVNEEDNQQQVDQLEAANGQDNTIIAQEPIDSNMEDESAEVVANPPPNNQATVSKDQAQENIENENE